MKALKKNKGFTLVELIVVIAIIGILAAVLIPSITGYIDKARRSNDVQLAGSMNTHIQAYCAENEIQTSSLLGTDIRTILLMADYTLVPRTNKWVFMFDVQKGLVEVVDIEKGVFAAAIETNPVDPTNLEIGRYLISKGRTDVERAVDLLCNLTSAKEYEMFKNGGLYANSVYSTVFSKFNPNNTLFIRNGGYFTNATTKITNIVCSELTVHIPNVKSELEFELTTNKTPAVVRTIEEGSNLTKYFSSLNQVSEKNINKIELDEFKRVEQGDIIYKIKLGQLVVNSTVQVFSDEIISTFVTEFTVDEGDNAKKYLGVSTVRKLTVSYYNQNGLYARGFVTYTIYNSFEK